MKYPLKILLDAHAENHWIIRQLGYWQEHCEHVAVHIGSVWDKRKHEWPKVIGEKREDMIRTVVNEPGSPKWTPDVILVDMGTRCGDQGSRVKRPKDAFKCIYFADLHRRRSPRNPNGDNRHRQYAQEYNIAFGRQKWVIESWDNGVWLPHDFHKQWIPPDTTQEPEYDICFQGWLTEERILLLERLKKEGLKIYYNGDNLPRQEYIKTLYNGKFTFNLTRTENEINAKVFEMLATGRLLFTNRVKKHSGLEDLFVDGKHLIIYNNYDQLVEKMLYYKEHYDEAKRIAANGKREVYEKHCSEKRAEKMLAVIWEFYQKWKK